MSRSARIGAGIALWLAVMIVGFYFTRGDDATTEEPPVAVATTQPDTSAPATTTQATTTSAAPVETPTADTTTTTTAPPTTTTTTLPPGPTTQVVATLENGRFTLSGVVPDEATAQGLLQAAGIVYGPDIGNQLEVTADAPASPWLAGAPRTVTLLPMIGQGSISVTDAGVEISGTAPNAPILEAFEQAVAASVGTDTVTSTVEVTNLGFPSFNARRIGDSLVLSGTLAGEAARDNIVQGAIAVYGADVVDDQTTIGENLDTPFWTYTLPGVFQLLAPFPDYEIDIENGVTSGSLNAGANFDIGSAELKPETESLLGVALAILTRDPTLGMQIAGHTDSAGSEAFNQQLSEARADSAAQFLIAAGIDPARLVSVGFGETQPIASNDTSAGRALNRRVEFGFGPVAEITAAP